MTEASEQSQWPLEGIRIVTVFKVESFDIFHHTNENPYYQISVDGSVFDSFGEVSPANIQFNADDGDIETVSRLEKCYCVGSLHWLSPTPFFVIGGRFNFYGPDTTPVAWDKYDAINDIFISSSERRRHQEEPETGALNVSYIGSLCDKTDGSLVMINCVVTGFREINTKSGTAMCFATVEDSTGSVQITVLGELYPEVSNLLTSEETLCITGKLEITESGMRVLVDKSNGFVKAT